MRAGRDARLNYPPLPEVVFQQPVSYPHRTPEVLDECTHLCRGTLKAIKQRGNAQTKRPCCTRA